MAKTGTSGMFHSVPSGCKPEDGRKSATQNTSVGSGSRPSKSQYAIESSAPADPMYIRGNISGDLK